MEQGYSFGNIAKNMTRKQKVLSILFVLIVVILIIILSVMLSNYNQPEAEEETEVTTDVTERNEVINGQDYVVTKETTVNADGETEVTETKMDSFGNVTTTEPNLITTYFPYQVVREHEDGRITLRYSLRIQEDSNVINAAVEGCDVENDKKLVQEYLNSIPIDLSNYTINYVPFFEDAFCD